MLTIWMPCVYWKGRRKGIWTSNGSRKTCVNLSDRKPSVLNLNTSFGYFDAKDEDVGVLRKIFASLNPGGRLVMDFIGKEKLARIFQPTVSEKLEDGTLLVQRHEIFDEWSRIRNEWIIIKGPEVRTFEFHHTVYSGQELKDRLLAAGFRDVKLYGSFEGEEYGRESNRFVAVAGKPKLKTA